MALLFVAAEADELQPFAEKLTALRKLRWPVDYAWEGILDGRRVLLAANGAGPELATRAVETAIRAVSAAELSSSRLEGVISVGYCGALQPNLPEKTIIIPSAVNDGASGETFPCTDPHLTQQMNGVLLSQNRIAGTSTDKAALGTTGAIAVDMESGGVALRAKRADLPFCCIKVVSDRLDESFAFDLNAMRAPSGRVARGKIVSYALTHPALLPELFRLRRRSRETAQVLGEFLVSCRIHLEGEPALAG